MLLVPSLLLAFLPLQEWRATVGVPVEIDGLVLPAPELEPTPQTLESPLVLRRVAVSPHGTAFRYDLEVYGLDPGEYDLRDFLQTLDGSARGDLPSLPFEVQSILAAGQIRPNALQAGDPPGLGGYRVTMIVLGVLWIAGLVLFVISGRRARRAEEEVPVRELTAADRLRPLVQQALSGKLERDQRARLELTLLAFWRSRLGLEDSHASEALAQIREHPEAGELLVALEEWLHQPSPPEQGQVDVNALLEPYKDVSAASLQEAGA